MPANRQKNIMNHMSNLLLHLENGDKITVEKDDIAAFHLFGVYNNASFDPKTMKLESYQACQSFELIYRVDTSDKSGNDIAPQLGTDYIANKLKKNPVVAIEVNFDCSMISIVYVPYHRSSSLQRIEHTGNEISIFGSLLSV